MTSPHQRTSHLGVGNAWSLTESQYYHHVPALLLSETYWGILEDQVIARPPGEQWGVSDRLIVGAWWFVAPKNWNHAYMYLVCVFLLSMLKPWHYYHFYSAGQSHWWHVYMPSEDRWAGFKPHNCAGFLFHNLNFHTCSFCLCTHFFLSHYHSLRHPNVWESNKCK